MAYGYSNIFVTAPSPENLSTVFEFVLKGFDLLHFRLVFFVEWVMGEGGGERGVEDLCALNSIDTVAKSLVQLLPQKKNV